MSGGGGAVRVIRKLQLLHDVDRENLSDGTVPTYRDASGKFEMEIPQGGGGGPSGGTLYIHNQSSPSAVWIVTHNLSTWPSVTVIDTGDSEIIPDVSYDSANQITLRFGSATSGKAYLN